jgi:hypothetical protein
MTPDEAGTIVATLSAAFPHPPITPERLELLVAEIALLADGDVGYQAARGFARNGEWFPKISEFRAAYHAIAKARREATPRLNEPPHDDELPRWVQVWTWARWIRDPHETRAFPQQRDGHQTTYADGDKPPDYLTDDEYQWLEFEWTEAGSPKWKATEILRTAGVAA